LPSAKTPFTVSTAGRPSASRMLCKRRITAQSTFRRSPSALFAGSETPPVAALLAKLSYAILTHSIPAVVVRSRQPKLKDGADYERLSDTRRFPLDSLSSKIQTPLRIGLPEINSRAQPIILIVAWAEQIAPEKPLTDPPVTAVIAKNERRAETVQGLTVIPGELARLGIDALGDQDLSRSLPRFSCSRCEGLSCISEAVERFAAADVERSAGSILPAEISLHNPQCTAVRFFEHVLLAADFRNLHEPKFLDIRRSEPPRDDAHPG